MVKFFDEDGNIIEFLALITNTAYKVIKDNVWILEKLKSSPR